MVAHVIELARPPLMPLLMSADETTFALQMFTLATERPEHNNLVMFL